MKLRQSADGVWRVTLRVDHRVGLDDLAAAIGYAIEFETCEATADCSQLEGLGNLTRRDVLNAARTAYHEFGEVGFVSAAGRNLDRYGVSEADCLRRARQLFPEFPQGDPDA